MEAAELEVPMLALTSSPDWNLLARDYAVHRAGFPRSFYDHLASSGVIAPRLRALDLGAGTGAVTLELAARGLDVLATDIASAALAECERTASERGLRVTTATVPAEDTGLPAGSFDLVTAGQCWHWLDRPRAAREVMRVLRPGGRLVIAHFDFLERETGPVHLALRLFDALRGAPCAYPFGTRGLYPEWIGDLESAGLTDLRTSSYDEPVAYSREGWRGRMRACQWYARLPAAQQPRFDAQLAVALEALPEPLMVPHRVFVLTVRKPELG